MARASGVEYSTVKEIKGPLMVVENVSNVAYDELVEIETGAGERRLGRVIEVGGGRAVVQVFEGTQGLSISETRARFLGKTMELGVSEDMLGRIFDGLGRPIDGLPEPVAEEYRDINGDPINPNERDYPSDFIQTGISAIDGMNSLVRGQKLPIFSGAGLPHNLLAAQIARQATVPGKEEEFAVIFAAVGVQNDEARFFRRSLEDSGAISRSALFLNLADDPAVERVITPRVALTLAEYLAFEKDYHVLVIITDMTNYCFSGDTEILLANGDVKKIGSIVEQAYSYAVRNSPSPMMEVRSAPSLLQIAAISSYAIRSYEDVLSWRNFGLQKCRIMALEKIVAPPKLIVIKTRSGAVLKVTHDQKILVDTELGPRMIEARNIKVGDELYSIERLEYTPTSISLLSLLAERECERFYIHVEDSFLETILREACGKPDVDYAGISDSYRKKCYRLDELIKIAHELDIPISMISEKIKYVTADGETRVKLKETYVSPRLLRVLGLVLSDGIIYESEKTGTYYVSFNSRSHRLINEFVELIREVFDGVRPRINVNQDRIYVARINSLVVTRILANLAQIGCENELLPLLKLPPEHVAAFLSGYIDGAGSVDLKNKCICLTTSSETRARRIQLLLKILGIQSLIQERDKAGISRPLKVYDIVIRGGKSLKKFVEKVRLGHPAKKTELEKLRKIVQSGRNLGTEKFYLAPRVTALLLHKLRERYNIKQRELGFSSMFSRFGTWKRRLSREMLRNFLEKIACKVDPGDNDYLTLKLLINGNYILDEVVEIKEVECGDAYVYDVTVPETSVLIVANGVIVSNCESLREISAAREEVPGRKGYPGYMYTDLASIHERAGRIKGRKGSLTQMPILTMPSDDITHPIPDLTGYITEGQLVLSRDLYRKGIYPPINVLMSLSRLMGPGIIAEKRTRPDHGEVSNQLYASYARAVQLRALSEIVGKSGLSDIDLKYLEFGDLFEQRFLKQGYDENRTLDHTIDFAWEILSVLPESELTKIKEETLKKYYKKKLTIRA